MADESSSSSADHQAAAAAAAAAFHALQQQQQQHHQPPTGAAAATPFHAQHPQHDQPHLQSQPPTSSPTPALSADASAVAVVAATAGGVRGPYRGRCLYKTGKCLNERALKTSGTAHNLCDEHRRRQNEHQRKLDMKNRNTRREKRSHSPFPAGELSIDSTNAVDSSDLHKRSGKRSHMRSPAKALASRAAAIDSKSGVFMLGSGGAQPPQVFAPSSAMQDFDGVVVPLPSYFEGAERVEFRARVYQKVLDFMSEECIRLFGAKSERASESLPETSGLSAADAVHTGTYLTALTRPLALPLQVPLALQHSPHVPTVAAAAAVPDRRGDGDSESETSDDVEEEQRGGGGSEASIELQSSRKEASRSEV